MTTNIEEQFWLVTNKKDRISQLQRYEQKGSPECIKRFIALGGGPTMGICLEEFARFKFKLLNKRGKGKNTGFDHIFEINGKVIYVEQKSSGHWGESDYRWQHIEPAHKWNLLLLCGIDYDKIRFWAMNRKIFEILVSENKITNQGNKEKESSEGMWFSYSTISEHLVPIENDDSLLEFVQTIFVE